MRFQVGTLRTVIMADRGTRPRGPERTPKCNPFHFSSFSSSCRPSKMQVVQFRERTTRIGTFQFAKLASPCTMTTTRRLGREYFGVEKYNVDMNTRNVFESGHGMSINMKITIVEPRNQQRQQLVQGICQTSDLLLLLLLLHNAKDIELLLWSCNWYHSAQSV